MSPPRSPLLGVEGQLQCNVSLMNASTSSECVTEKLGLYLGLSDSSSENSKSTSNLNATELRLGLPGSQSSDLRPGKHDEKQLFPLIPSKDGICSLSQKTVASGNKRGFADTVDTFSESKTIVLSEGNWTFSSAGFDSGSNVMFSNRSPGTQSSVQTEVPAKTSNESNNNSNSAPVPKAQVVGWPPIRSFRKNCVAASKNSDGPSVLFVKVSMAGAPYLRKVDLKAYSTYGQLSSALEKMFTSFTSEYVLTYEDKDSDWMLVGDVPWEMFIASCRRLKIMKGPDAIGLGPRSRGVEKEKSKNRT